VQRNNPSHRMAMMKPSKRLKKSRLKLRAKRAKLAAKN
jgi:hypothetical protein